MTFDPRALLDPHAAALPRPKFLVIVASNVLAERLARGDGVDGFIVELPVAGGHNAPPRNAGARSPEGEPVYGEKDRIDWERFRDLGKPFWAAGGCATPERFAEVRAGGGMGVQIGTAFAFCAESGLDERFKSALLQKVRDLTARVFTDPDASPTGYPFKVAELAGSLSDAAVYAARRRMCDLGFLREAYRKPDGAVAFRCPAEPVDAFVAKGGAPERTIGRKCLCNGLMANIGLGQRRAEGGVEPPLLTAGDDLTALARFLKPGARSYTAADVVRFVLQPALAV